MPPPAVAVGEVLATLFAASTGIGGVLGGLAGADTLMQRVAEKPSLRTAFENVPVIPGMAVCGAVVGAVTPVCIAAFPFSAMYHVLLKPPKE